jgi:hypothetical protein
MHTRINDDLVCRHIFSSKVDFIGVFLGKKFAVVENFVIKCEMCIDITESGRTKSGSSNTACSAKVALIFVQLLSWYSRGYFEGHTKLLFTVASLYWIYPQTQEL